MASRRRNFGKLKRMRDNGIQCHMKSAFTGGAQHYLYSIRGSHYMTQNEVNPYLRSIGIDPATMQPLVTEREYGVWRKVDGIRVRVLPPKAR